MSVPLWLMQEREALERAFNDARMAADPRRAAEIEQTLRAFDAQIQNMLAEPVKNRQWIGGQASPPLFTPDEILEVPTATGEIAGRTRDGERLCPHGRVMSGYCSACARSEDMARLRAAFPGDYDDDELAQIWRAWSERSAATWLAVPKSLTREGAMAVIRQLREQQLPTVFMDPQTNRAYRQLLAESIPAKLTRAELTGFENDKPFEAGRRAGKSLIVEKAAQQIAEQFSTKQQAYYDMIGVAGSGKAPAIRPRAPGGPRKPAAAESRPEPTIPVNARRGYFED